MTCWPTDFYWGPYKDDDVAVQLLILITTQCMCVFVFLNCVLCIHTTLPLSKVLVTHFHTSFIQRIVSLGCVIFFSVCIWPCRTPHGAKGNKVLNCFPINILLINNVPLNSLISISCTDVPSFHLLPPPYFHYTLSVSLFLFFFFWIFFNLTLLPWIHSLRSSSVWPTLKPTRHASSVPTFPATSSRIGWSTSCPTRPHVSACSQSEA